MSVVHTIRLPTSPRRSPCAWTTAAGVKLPNDGEVNSIKTFLELAGVLI